MVMLGSTDVRLGCQGWTEADWTGPFYPAGIKGAERLAAYARVFDFVEVDSSFYAVPPPERVLNWYDSTPEGFGFAAKVPQSITHDPDPKSRMPRRPLEGERWREELERFTETMGLLEEKLMALVVQLPPQWHWRPERLGVLEEFLGALPDGLPWAIEFRHRGWLNEEVMGLLEGRGVALVNQDLYYMPRQVEMTTPELSYIRLQGRRKEIERMDAVQIERDEALDFWAGAVRELAARGVRRVIVAANNHYQGFSPGTVAGLQRRVGLPVAAMPASTPPFGGQGRLEMEA
jgi:uncharacterized protein YecE (DUF72 family)